jgi:hypothetical protein
MGQYQGDFDNRPTKMNLVQIQLFLWRINYKMVQTTGGISY